MIRKGTNVTIEREGLTNRSIFPMIKTNKSLKQVKIENVHQLVNDQMNK